MRTHLQKVSRNLPSSMQTYDDNKSIIQYRLAMVIKVLVLIVVIVVVIVVVAAVTLINVVIIALTFTS